MEVLSPDKIRRGRLQKGYSQRELAYLVRRSQSAIQFVESGRMKNITEAFALGLANRLNIPWEELFRSHERLIPPKVSNGSRTNDDT